MSLHNLVGMTLEEICPDAIAIRRLRDAAALSLQDAALDGLRKQRNVIDYSGDLVSASMALAALEQARLLIAFADDWLRVNRPTLHS